MRMETRVKGNSSEPVCLGIKGIKKATNLGRSTIFKLISDGTLPSFTIGNRRLVTRDAIVEFVRRREQAGQVEFQSAASRAAKIKAAHASVLARASRRAKGSTE